MSDTNEKISILLEAGHRAFSIDGERVTAMEYPDTENTYPNEPNAVQSREQNSEGRPPGAMTDTA